ncbi:hypothetical protein C8R44DRAFT_739001 [Mycena epipterygia]|nr:hypothetical protein C8R44DRAFT_739001 [Mycena epipterygia]
MVFWECFEQYFPELLWTFDQVLRIQKYGPKLKAKLVVPGLNYVGSTQEWLRGGPENAPSTWLFEHTIGGRRDCKRGGVGVVVRARGPGALDCIDQRRYCANVLRLDWCDIQQLATAELHICTPKFLEDTDKLGVEPSRAVERGREMRYHCLRGDIDRE